MLEARRFGLLDMPDTPVYIDASRLMPKWWNW